MKKVPVSQIDELEDFGIVRLIDDDTREPMGYFLDSRYKELVESLWETTQSPSSSGQKVDGIDLVVGVSL